MQSCFQLSLLFYFSFLALSLSVLLHLSWSFSLSRLCFTAQRSMWTLYVAMNLISHGPKSKERKKEGNKEGCSSIFNSALEDNEAVGDIYSFTKALFFCCHLWNILLLNLCCSKIAFFVISVTTAITLSPFYSLFYSFHFHYCSNSSAKRSSQWIFYFTVFLTPDNKMESVLYYYYYIKLSLSSYCQLLPKHFAD